MYHTVVQYEYRIIILSKILLILVRYYIKQARYLKIVDRA